MKKQTTIEAGSTEQKTFKYSKGVTNLSFTLRIDIKQELKDFLELLERAVEDVKIQLDKQNV